MSSSEFPCKLSLISKCRLVSLLNDFNIKLEPRRELFPSVWESPLRVVWRRVMTILIFHTKDVSPIFITKRFDREIKHFWRLLTTNKDFHSVTPSFP